MSDETRFVAVEDGKYVVKLDARGAMTFLRHGEPWEVANRDFAHVGLIRALAEGLLEMIALRTAATKRAEDAEYTRDRRADDYIEALAREEAAEHRAATAEARVKEQAIEFALATRVADAAVRFCEDLCEDSPDVPDLQLRELHQALDDWEGIPRHLGMFDSGEPAKAALSDIAADCSLTDGQRRAATTAYHGLCTAESALQEALAREAWLRKVSADWAALSYQWMECHDKLKAGLPYDLPRPETPSGTAALIEAGLRAAIVVPLYGEDYGWHECLICKVSHERAEAIQHDPDCLLFTTTTPHPWGEVVRAAVEEAFAVPAVWSREETDGLMDAYYDAAAKHGTYETIFAVAAWILRHRHAKACAAIIEKEKP